MAKKKTPAKKVNGTSNSSKKAASKKPVAKNTKPTKPLKATTVKTVKPTAKANAAKANGNSKAEKKDTTQVVSTKKIAVNGNGNPASFKAKNNGTADEKGLNPQTYQMLRQDIISTLWKYDEITFDELCAAMEKIHGRNFVNDSQKYLHQVMTDLTNIDLIEKVEQAPNRHAYRIRQRLGD